MLRASDAKDAAYISAVLHRDGLTIMQWGGFEVENTTAENNEIQAPKLNYEILQLQRRGNDIIMRVAHWK